MAYFTCASCNLHYSTASAHSPLACTGRKPAIKLGQLWNRRTPNGRLIGVKIMHNVQGKLWSVQVVNGQHAGTSKLFSTETIYTLLELDH